MQLTCDMGKTAVLMGEQDARLMFSALVDNAVKHHPTKSGHILVSARTDGPCVRVRVCDDGAGIEEKLYTKAIGAMTTLRPRDEVEGSGMGLANVRKIAAHYGGHMRLSACTGGLGGLCVDVTLPLASQTGA